LVCLGRIGWVEPWLCLGLGREVPRCAAVLRDDAVGKAVETQYLSLKDRVMSIFELSASLERGRVVVVVLFGRWRAGLAESQKAQQAATPQPSLQASERLIQGAAASQRGLELSHDSEDAYATKYMPESVKMS
jgi:hypothetical protein